VIGALILQTLTTTVFTVGIPSQYETVFKAVVIIIVFLLQSPRLRGSLRRRRRPAPAPLPPGTLPAGPVPTGTAVDDGATDGSPAPAARTGAATDTGQEALR
jgi:galactofuranose transport system permease protein